MSKMLTQLHRERRAGQRVDEVIALDRYAWRGANAAVLSMEDGEIVVSGPAGCGKSLALLAKLDGLMRQYSGARGLIVRKVERDLVQSVLVTYERDVLGRYNPICVGARREGREIYRYPNGSEVAVAGLDRPGKLLSADFDFIYAAEAVQLTEDDWETLVMRNRSGVVPFQQLVADTNPGHARHWLKARCDAGRASMLWVTHQDNPALWDDVAQRWTARGQDYVVGKLGRLTGIRRKRYLEGKWVAAEGMVFDAWDEALHVVDGGAAWGLRPEVGRQPGPLRRVIAAVDWGYTNPGVMQIWAVDRDSRMALVHEVYQTRKLIDWWVDRGREAQRNFGVDVFYCDPSEPAYLAAFNKAGLRAVAAQNAILPGIQAVQARLAVVGDGRPRLVVLRGALAALDAERVEARQPCGLVEEISGYVWAEAKEGRAAKEVPAPGEDHSLDCLRYAVMAVDGQQPGRVRHNPFYG